MDTLTTDTLTTEVQAEPESTEESRTSSSVPAITQIRVKGKAIPVPSVDIDGRTVVVTGRWLKVASIQDEDLISGNSLPHAESFLRRLRESGLKADVFTFAQRLPDVEPRYRYRVEWENVAAAPTASYAQWWSSVSQAVRKNVNRSKKAGVTVEVVEFSDALLDAIRSIYNETPFRQGKQFWHYGKDREVVKRALASDLDQSIFLGAYFQGELIGFMKIAWVGPTGFITQILSMTRHFEKNPNNAMIAKAIELCEAKGMAHFIYGQFVYYDPDSSLTEFKRRNGFESISLPRYYVPLNGKGKIALALRLHRGLAANTPKAIFRLSRKLRKYWYDRKLRRKGRAPATEA
jgi:hypothetical protein